MGYRRSSAAAVVSRVASREPLFVCCLLRQDFSLQDVRLATGHSTVDVLGETAVQSGGNSCSGRSAGSEAGVVPAPLLAVAGAGGMGGA
jgi:hypothetical protein